MYEVRARDGQLLSETMFLSVSKAIAESAAKNFGKPFDVWEVKQVWTTQTLDEAVNEDVYGDNDSVAKRIDKENDKAIKNST